MKIHANTMRVCDTVTDSTCGLQATQSCSSQLHRLFHENKVFTNAQVFTAPYAKLATQTVPRYVLRVNTSATHGTDTFCKSMGLELKMWAMQVA